LKKSLIIAVALAAAALASVAQVSPPPSAYAAPTYIANSVTVSGAAAAVKGLNVKKTYQVASQTSSGAGSTVVNIEGSNNPNGPWDVIGTVTLTTGTTAISGSFTSLDSYAWVRANATTLTGTGAQYTATMGF
jgi:hypothetical protein